MINQSFNQSINQSTATCTEYISTSCASCMPANLNISLLHSSNCTGCQSNSVLYTNRL